jgi:hypothetical protein
MADSWTLSVIKPRSKGELRTTEYLIKTETSGPIASLVTFGDLPQDEQNVARLIKSAPDLLHALVQIGQIASRQRCGEGALSGDLERVRTIAFYAVRKATEGKVLTR